MTLQEIKEKIPDSNPGDIVGLAKEFDRTLQELCGQHKDFRDFNDEYRSEINNLKLTRHPENAAELSWMVDSLISTQERLGIK